MKERPILFSAPMVRAILAGDKTQTRRIVKFPHHNPLVEWEPITIGGERGGRTASGEKIPEQGGIFHTRTGEGLMCPHGQPGDRLWVRETWRGVVKISPPNAVKPEYGVARYVPDKEHCKRIEYAATEKRDADPWRPSIHMPRWASRILLEITCVRVERLLDISQADAYAEGAMSWAQEQETQVKDLNGGDDRIAFMALWESIGGAGSWAANPWVWVVEFRRIA
ncbi:hypothetical protein [Herbaspirillum sp. CAH-3]|uniref:hypothetical protein n=1 Tax=Herbaspirillum sp. CAH-3 TaxID=2605746 RepID=UPI001392C1C1|nr:hypothetical protein [Herbaspirillum sp. CAH-3]